jgi:abequosyltransferase
LLNTALKSILSEASFDARCEIVVSDNSKGDETRRLVETTYAGIPRLRYRRSLDAPSLDENVNKVIVSSAGEYVWVFGDDDIIEPAFLPRLLECLECERPDIVLINSRSFEQGGIIEERRVPAAERRIYNTGDNDAFLTDFGSYLTYVPCLVIRRECWIDCFRTEMIGTFFAHIDAVFRAKRGRTARFIPEPGINMRMHCQTWTARHFEIWNVHFPAVIWGLEEYGDEAKGKVIPRYPLRSLKRIFGSRAYGRFDFSIWRTVLLPSQHSSLLVKTVGLLVALLPRELFRLLYVGYIRVMRHQHNPHFSPELALAQLGRKK